MPHFDASPWALTAGVAALAGYTDGVAFSRFEGLFVSFMTGNAIRAGVGAVTNQAMALQAGILLASFVVGIAGGAILGATGRSSPAPKVLSFVAVLMASTALFGSSLPVTGSGAILAMAMGAINTVFDRDAKVGVGLTYMTGSLVRFTQHVIDYVEGRSVFGWVPYLAVWMSFMGGVVLGALAYLRWADFSIWAAVIVAALLAFLTFTNENIST